METRIHVGNRRVSRRSINWLFLGEKIIFRPIKKEGEEDNEDSQCGFKRGVNRIDFLD